MHAGPSQRHPRVREDVLGVAAAGTVNEALPTPLGQASERGPLALMRVLFLLPLLALALALLTALDAERYLSALEGPRPRSSGRRLGRHILHLPRAATRALIPHRVAIVFAGLACLAGAVIPFLVSFAFSTP
ncbi:MAG: hypothetical protein H0U90_00870 [Actinobacteria bacterium]|nr:hypothetical protein [Actinomycetota bacterium]